MLRDYSPVIEDWVRGFIATMDANVKAGFAEPGDDSGTCPQGIKIIFDGYGYNETTDENDNTDQLSFAVFVHQTSLTSPFPPHEVGFGLGLVHRPTEECCTLVWYNVPDDFLEILYFEEADGTEMDHEAVVDLMFKIHERDQG